MERRIRTCTCSAFVLFSKTNDLIFILCSYVINSEAMKKLYKTMKGRPAENSEPKDVGREWHSDSRSRLCWVEVLVDISIGLFENCPSDFSFLRMQATPPAGGDTLWCSGYDL